MVAAFAKDEETYMEVIRSYGPREEGNDHAGDHFGRALGHLMLPMQHECRDYLGAIYEEQAAANQHVGQFFTPEHLCKAMADMIAPNVQDHRTVPDPCCGSGRLLIPLAHRNRFANIFGVDLDRTCVHMATLNILFRNCNAYIAHGDSLRLQFHGGYRVRRTFAGGEVHKLTKEEVERIFAPRLKEAIADKAPGAHAVTAPENEAPVEEIKRQFAADKKGQFDLGF